MRSWLLKWFYRGATGLMLLLGFAAWLLSIVFMALTMLMAIIGRLIPHDPTFGNCWVYALPRYYKRGGSLLIRPADGVRLLGIFSIPHVAWVTKLPRDGVELEAFDPIRRYQSRWMPWRTVWYHGRVKRTESPHPARSA